MNLDDLISMCNGSVHLTVNGHLSYYESLSDKFHELDAIDGDGEWCTEKEKRKIIENNCIVELQFYPDTPIGFVKVVTFSVEDALRQAKEYFDEKV